MTTPIRFYAEARVPHIGLGQAKKDIAANLEQEILENNRVLEGKVDIELQVDVKGGTTRLVASALGVPPDFTADPIGNKAKIQQAIRKRNKIPLQP